MGEDENVNDETNDTTDEINNAIPAKRRKICCDSGDRAKVDVQGANVSSKNGDNGKPLNNLRSSDFRALQRTYGRQLSCYLENGDSGIRRTKTGAFVIQKPGCFATCLDFLVKRRREAKRKRLKRSIQKHGKKKNRLQRSIKEHKEKPQLPVEPARLQGERLKNSPAEESNRKETSKWINTTKPAFVPKTCRQKLNVATFMTINFYSTKADGSYTRPPGKAFDFSQTSANRDKLGHDGVELYNLAMKTSIGNEDLDKHEDFADPIRTILGQMQRRHRRFQYYTVLDRVLIGRTPKDSKNVFHIELKWYLEFVYKVFTTVIPPSLFGSNRNAKTLRKVLKAYYLSPYKSPVNLEQCVDRLNISAILWLKAYETPKLKWTILAKITKWIFESYFFPMFGALFQEQRSLGNDKKVIMSRQRWNNFQRNYIASNLRLGNLRKLSHRPGYSLYRSNQVPRVSMFLYPKANGDARRVHISQIERDQLRDIEILDVFLKQAYLSKHGLISLNDNMVHAKWRKYATKKDKNAWEKLNLVICDVSDAFGSIIQEKLMDILNKMIAEIISDDLLTLQWHQIIIPGPNRTLPKIEYKRWFTCFPEPPPTKACSLIVPRTNEHRKLEYVKKDFISARLRSFVLEQSWWHRSEEYSPVFGVCQGTKLSTIFAEIYYQQMTAEVFGIFMKSGTLFRYVDDYIYMTPDEPSANRFLQTVQAGIGEWNCYFGRDKIQANFASQFSKGSEWVVFLGYQLNGTTMEVRPMYNKTELQYTPGIVKLLREKRLPYFAQYVNNTKALKLPLIVLDPRLNNEIGLCATAKLVAERQAARCIFFLTTVYTSQQLMRYAKCIMLKIRAVVKKLEDIFCRRLTPSDEAKWPDYRRNLSLAIWQSWDRTFARSQQLLQHFRKYMKPMIPNRARPPARAVL